MKFNKIWSFGEPPGKFLGTINNGWILEEGAPTIKVGASAYYFAQFTRKAA